ncbi:hypothetical protein ACIOMM_05050 [Streptomyces sp. NPDC087908]|uniref:hypothetical protein n=1 Tax=Streptomyces sp. NPDC087908 TaxID=3365820 RepID=UPI00381AB408
MQSHTIGRAAPLPGAGPDTARRPTGVGRLATRREESGRPVIDGRPFAELPAGEEPGLEVGMQATARVKSTSVHIERT